MKKTLLLVGSAIAGLLVIAALAIPFLVDANQFRPTLEGTLAASLGRKVTIGKAGPFNPSDAAQTPLHATLTVTNFNPASTGFVDPASGIAGLIGLKADLVSDGRRLDSTGKVRATKLQLVRGGSPARVPIDIDYESDYDLKAQRGVVKRGEVRIGKATAQLTHGSDTLVQVLGSTRLWALGFGLWV